MTRPTTSSAPPTPYSPPWPTLIAFGLCCLWIAILSLPMWSGHLLAGQWSDQFATGYAFRYWDAAQWRATGHLPLWNPHTFAGHPTFAGFGDLFYPTTWLRLVLPAALAIDIGFVAHYVLAGFALYLLLRLLGISWAGAVTGGTTYQLSGVVVSLVSPGHDGKLFVTALLPVMLIGLVLGIRRRRPEGFALLGLAIGLALLSPQYQMTQYALVASGLFTLYLAFGDPEGLGSRERWLSVAAAAAGVGLGFGISLIQVLPFFHYIPYSPRAEAGGFAWSASYAMPWSHVPELLLSGFAGHYETYWGPNSLKLHSEYLGLPVLALAAVGAGSPRRKLVWWLSGIGGLFLLVCLGSGTPFYRVWYALVPYVSKTRAPGMALYVVALVVSMLAALGVERLERGEGKRAMQVALVTASLVALLAVAGVFGSMAEGIARGLPAGHEPDPVTSAATRSEILVGALGSAIGAGLVAALTLGFLSHRVPSAAFATLLVLLVGADLYRAGRGFWHWSHPEQEQFALDPIIKHLHTVPAPFRLFDPPQAAAYSRTTLLRHDISQMLGESGIELRTFDELLGGRLRWENLGNLHLWRLLAIRFVLLPDTVQLAGYHRVLGPVTTGAGRTAYLYEADTVPPYARVVPAAVKGDSDRIIPTLIDPRLDYSRLVLLTPDQPINPLPVVEMPPLSPSRASFAHWAPGKMSVTLDPAPPADSYLLIAESWYPDWRATVDGQPTPVLRGDWTFLTVPVRAGSKRVELEFVSRDFARGRIVTWVSLLVLVAWAGGAVTWRRAHGSG